MLVIWVFLGSVVGIALMVLLNQRLGLNTPAQIYSVEEAVKRLDADQVGFVPGGASVLADDHRSAIIEEADTGRLGLLAARGDGVVIRYIEPGSVRAAKMSEGRDILLELNDFTFSPVQLSISDTSTARLWADRLNSLQD